LLEIIQLLWVSAEMVGAMRAALVVALGISVNVVVILLSALLLQQAEELVDPMEAVLQEQSVHFLVEVLVAEPWKIMALSLDRDLHTLVGLA
jgi:hypothetical protein